MKTFHGPDRAIVEDIKQAVGGGIDSGASLATESLGIFDQNSFTLDEIDREGDEGLSSDQILNLFLELRSVHDETPV
jgi:hypothetical protein